MFADFAIRTLEVRCALCVSIVGKWEKGKKIRVDGSVSGYL